jgi:hypothetical protein
MVRLICLVCIHLRLHLVYILRALFRCMTALSMQLSRWRWQLGERGVLRRGSGEKSAA